MKFLATYTAVLFALFVVMALITIHAPAVSEAIRWIGAIITGGEIAFLVAAWLRGEKDD